MTIEEQIKIMQAYKDGRVIEFRDKITKVWFVGTPLWNWMDVDYRIKVGKWHPKRGSYLVNLKGEVASQGRSAEQDIVEFGVSFPNYGTAKKAAKAYKAYHRLYQLAEELNRGWEPDWENRTSLSWYIDYSEINKDYGVMSACLHRNLSCVYFKSSEVARQAIEVLQAEEDG
ncbi:MAG: hypothetical protein DRH08_06565 [Deltaproteobacteria bacterium]|nr:MAG: hypothetical protein DRH08_06565 [Deltaproteobacteria bacterium]